MLAALVLAMLIGTLRDESFWHTRNQLAYRAYQRGDYAEALNKFHDSSWKAAACFRSADYTCALQNFAITESAISDFNLGNAHARAGDLKAAAESYQAALKRRANWTEASENLQIVSALVVNKSTSKDKREPGDEPQERPDGTAVDEKGKQGKPGEVSIEKLDPKAIDQLWLRNVKTDPADFLRLRFAGETAATENKSDPAR